jgi:uncharacterized protein
MKIDVSDLLKSVGAVIKIDESETFDFKEDGLELASPVEVKLKLTDIGDGVILVAGTLKTNAKLVCCRCLKEFDQPLNVKIEEQYSKKASERDEEADEEIELKDEDFVFDISENNIIDLDEAIRQNLIVSLPIKPLCKKMCTIPGLEGKTKKKFDPRLEKLGKLVLQSRTKEEK